MRRALPIVLGGLLLAGSAGCCSLGGCPPQATGPYGCSDRAGHTGLVDAMRSLGRRIHGAPEPPLGGPPVGTVSYPYYTVRGPRDFLKDQPPSIGP